MALTSRTHFVVLHPIMTLNCVFQLTLKGQAALTVCLSVLVKYSIVQCSTVQCMFQASQRPAAVTICSSQRQRMAIKLPLAPARYCRQAAACCTSARPSGCRQCLHAGASQQLLHRETHSHLQSGWGARWGQAGGSELGGGEPCNAALLGAKGTRQPTPTHPTTPHVIDMAAVHDLQHRDVWREGQVRQQLGREQEALWRAVPVLSEGG